jgi:hypothetical protein
VPASSFLGLVDDHGICCTPQDLQQRLAAAQTSDPKAAPANTNGTAAAEGEAAGAASKAAAGETESSTPAVAAKRTSKVIELQPGDEYEISVVLQPDLRSGQTVDDLGLISQLILISAAVQATPGQWRRVVAARRVTAFLVGREAAAVSQLLRATAPIFVPKSLRRLLLTDATAEVHGAPELLLPLQNSMVNISSH